MSETIVIGGGAGAPGRIVIILGAGILFDTPIIRRTPASVPDDFPLRWATGLKNALDTKILDGWNALLATEEHFVENMANPAAMGYSAFLNPEKISRRGNTGMFSTMLHARKLRASYEKLVDAIAFLADEGHELFELKVDASRHAYRDGATLPLTWTGDYVTQVLGAAVRQWWFLNSDKRLLQYQWANDYREGDWPPDKPFLIDVPKWDVARRHQNLLVQGGVFMLRRLTFARVHDNLDEFLSTWISDDYLPPPESYIRLQQIPEGLGIRTFMAFVPTDE